MRNAGSFAATGSSSVSEPTGPAPGRGSTSGQLQALLLAAAALGAALVLGIRAPLGFPLDDAWIHQVVARGMAERTGAYSHDLLGGSTSPLWTVILTILQLLFSPNVVTPTRVVAVALWCVAVMSLYQLLRGDGWRTGEAFMATLCAAMTGNAVWFTATGMEVTLLIALQVTAVAAWRYTRVWRLTVLLSALVLARPEGIVLAGVTGAVALRTRGWRAPLILPAIVTVAFYGWVWWTTGSLMPGTLAGRRWLYGLEPAGLSFGLVAVLAQLALQIWSFTLGESWLQAGLVLAGLALALRSLVERSTPGLRLLLGLGCVSVGLYALGLPRIGHAGRYHALAIVLVLPCAALGLMAAVRELLGCRVPSWVAGLPILAIGLSSVGVWRPILRAGIDHINDTHGGIATWAGANIPARSRIAAFDIGAVAWHLPGRVTDLSGLSDPAVVDLLRAGAAERVIRAHDAEFVMLPIGLPGLNDLRPVLGLSTGPLELREVARRTTPEQEWRIVFEATSSAWPGQALYAVSEGTPPPAR